MIATDPQMFCFQCEQTAGCIGCMGEVGVCGKTADVARLQDELTGALIGLARVTWDGEVPQRTARLLIEGLFATLTNVNFDAGSILALTERVREERDAVAGMAPAPDYDLNLVWQAHEDVRSLKSLVLFGIRGMAAYAYHAMALGYVDDEINRFLVRALCALERDLDPDKLLPLVLEVGEKNYRCMELLDRANTSTYGTPRPTEVSMLIERGPFIVVSGHDLFDLHALLEQTAGTGVSVYTHGEMLPAHGYPELKKYPQLKGNFGTAWQNQQLEFDNIPGAVLFTTNCLMPPRVSYADRVFTTGVVSYPSLVHIGENRDFSPVIKRALELGGYPVDTQMTGVNGGMSLTTGYGHASVLAKIDRIVEAVREGKINHFYLVGGCDGAKPGRNYFTRLVRDTPKDSIVLTLACGKYRFNDLDLGTVAGLPRLMDLGQCNDAFGAITVALALAVALDCSVSELPLTIVLSWYEQKAVAVLLTLLYLGITNIKIGPTLPTFISPNVLAFLEDNYHLSLAGSEDGLREVRP